ncbi:hypothetical protein GCM10028809_23220 [Spirosoma gilvum]
MTFHDATGNIARYAANQNRIQKTHTFKRLGEMPLGNTSVLKSYHNATIDKLNAR